MEAMRPLSPAWLYEGRLLLRGSFELCFNYSWIRLQPVRRANRFMRFQVLEELNILREWPPELKTAKFKAEYRRLIQRRSELRHLFRRRNRQGKLEWARDWAGRSLEARIREIEKRKPHDQITDVAYGLYRWLSSGAHGGPQSLGAVLSPTRFGLRPKSQPELTQAPVLTAMGTLLLGVLSHAARDLNFSDGMKKELARLRVQILKASGLEPEDS